MIVFKGCCSKSIYYFFGNKCFRTFFTTIVIKRKGLSTGFLRLIIPQQREVQRQLRWQELTVTLKIQKIVFLLLLPFEIQKKSCDSIHHWIYPYLLLSYPSAVYRSYRNFRPKSTCCHVLFAPRKLIIFHVESIATNIDRFYAKYGVYNYASKSVYIEENNLLCRFYAGNSIFDAF